MNLKNKIVSLKQHKFRKEQKHLEKIMRERYGTVDKEWQAFLMCNREPELTETRCDQPLRELAQRLRKAHST